MLFLVVIALYIQALLPTTLSLGSEENIHSSASQQIQQQRSLDLAIDEGSARRIQKPNGDASCPCISLSQLNKPISLLSNTDSIFGQAINRTSYGIGCAPHDEQTSICSDSGCARTEPIPADCDKPWCKRSWCYVDADDCAILYKPSAYFKDRHYSYAACGDIDSFTLDERKNALNGSTYRVAFNSNTGGWKGAFNTNGSFAINDEWYGPAVDFVQASALVGNFHINMTRPPDWLYAESRRFYGDSLFDYCIYATSLGYLDFCVSGYTISDKRAASATFFELTSTPLYLITFADNSESFASEMMMAFRPFSWPVWVVIMFFFLPVLGVLMLVHERNAPGGAFPRYVPVLVRNENNGTEIREKHVPMIKHIAMSVYMGILAFFQVAYDHSVVTMGGKINLLAISIFVLMVSAVYTANLAAILTQNIQSTTVNDLPSAIKAGYHICMARRTSEIITDLYDIDPKRIVPDPVDIGGDGLPGFSCPKCASRARVFDFMKHDNTDPSQYCEVAIATLDDLEVLQSRGAHCNKTRVGDAIAQRSVGLPINPEVSEELISLFHQMKNNGYLNRAINEAYPESTCLKRVEEGAALTVKQMRGIWMLTFFFAAIGLIAKLFRKKLCRRGPSKERYLRRYDQWGNPTSHDIIINGKKFDPDNYEVDVYSEDTLSDVAMHDNSRGEEYRQDGDIVHDGDQEHQERGNGMDRKAQIFRNLKRRRR